MNYILLKTLNIEMVFGTLIGLIDFGDKNIALSPHLIKINKDFSSYHVSIEFVDDTLNLRGELRFKINSDLAISVIAEYSNRDLITIENLDEAISKIRKLYQIPLS